MSIRVYVVNAALLFTVSVNVPQSWAQEVNEPKSVVVAPPTTAAAPTPAIPSRLRAPDAKPSVEPLDIVIELTDDVRELKGSLLDTNDLEIKTAFGPVKIPLKEVLGIRMSREDDDITTFVLHNGDMITGSVDVRNLLVQTSWGKSEINGTNLASIFFAPGLKWEPLKLLAGKRWTLAETAELAPPPSNQQQTSVVPAANRESRSVLVKQ